MPPSDLNGAAWHKSSYSGGSSDNCVEVATNLPGFVAVRDSKDPSGPMLTFSPTAWTDFLTGIRSGEI
ncbi:DUF397 domain-containing protein [Streptosporangium sp. NBC_01755]|uniref:DUF397 domain-containing protein n=1 Tax=Streptosporangium sp. NBC_01755 TaxID=2975949 RepID=UPI002DD839E1|nr:DUF397 domain-containing protein [Streptosporangium sp. NBC_01755]WSD03181.1 DUF397 domain-containing protein [Streptosporangium sp. NBC_01755]